MRAPGSGPRGLSATPLTRWNYKGFPHKFEIAEAKSRGGRAHMFPQIAKKQNLEQAALTQMYP
jgi:hypothetical protein